MQGWSPQVVHSIYYSWKQLPAAAENNIGKKLLSETEHLICHEAKAKTLKKLIRFMELRGTAKFGDNFQCVHHVEGEGVKLHTVKQKRWD